MDAKHTNMNIPENLYYTKDHEWLKIEGDVALVGVTDFAQHQLGDIVFVEVNTVGENIATGEVFGTIEAVKTVSDMFMPLEAEVLEFNEALADTPELINQDPYGNGWIVKVKLADPSAVSELYTPGAYKELV